MMMWRRQRFMEEAGAGGAGGAATAAPPPGGTGDAPAPPAAAPAAQVTANTPAPAAPAASPPASTPAAAPPADDKPGYWAADWRERLAGGDDKTLKQLQRYASPEDVWKKARALEQRVSAGELKPALGKNATAEQVAEYRKSLGIPEAPDKYDLTGIQLDDVDKPLIGEVLKAAHGVNASPDVVKAVVGIWPQLKMQAETARVESDKKAQAAGEDALRSEWGGEYRRNISLVHQLLDSNGDATIKDQILSGRLADGTPIGSSPAALKLLLGVALAQNPAGTVVPAGGGDPVGTINDEIAKIEKVMNENRPAYNKDEKMQARYRELLGAREKFAAR